jgi:soluble lytic murein transglycosylase
MIKRKGFHALMALLPFFGSCFGFSFENQNPCRYEGLALAIKSFSKADLDSLAKTLSSKSYGNDEQDACQKALLAQISFAQGRMSEAANYFSLAAKKMPELSHYFLLAKAHAELRQDNFNQAQQTSSALLQSLSPSLSNNFLNRAKKILAEIAVRQKDYHQIIRTHEELLEKGYREDEAFLFNLGNALSMLGETAKADKIFKRLLMKFPASQKAITVEKAHGLARFHFDSKERDMRFEKMIESLAFDQVEKEADALLKDPKLELSDEDKSKISGAAIRALFFDNRFERGLSRAKQRKDAKNKTASDIENLAWSLAKLDRFSEASEAYWLYSKAASKKEDQARGCFFAGFSLYEASFYNMAQLTWHSCQDLMQKSPYHESYLWYQALAAMLNGDHKNAQNHLESLLLNFKKSNDIEKYSYFLAMTLRELKQKNAGDALLRALAKKREPSYYAMLAQKSLGLKAPLGKKIGNNALADRARCSDKTCENALTLYHLGFFDDARDLIVQAKMPNEERLALLQKMGNFHDVWQRSYLIEPKIIIEDQSLLSDFRMRAAFPLPYLDLVQEICARYGLKKELVLSIMGVESGFSLEAISNRGAMGPMQMMPFVAKDLAAKLTIPEFSAEKLKEPKVAIELAALLLATLKRQFFNTHLVLAAYNAGSHHVQRWLDRFGHLPTELFIERIPFKQTRDYVKKVLFNESLYVAFEGKELKLIF